MYDEYACNPKWNGNAKTYLEKKLKILKRDFRITPTEREIKHLETLVTQAAIDNGIWQIIDNHWN